MRKTIILLLILFGALGCQESGKNESRGFPTLVHVTEDQLKEQYTECNENYVNQVGLYCDEVIYILPIDIIKSRMEPVKCGNGQLCIENQFVTDEGTRIKSAKDIYEITLGHETRHYFEGNFH